MVVVIAYRCRLPWTDNRCVDKTVSAVQPAVKYTAARIVDTSIDNHIIVNAAINDHEGEIR
jgi:hypothetical protein